MLLRIIYCGSVKQLQLLRHRTVATLRSFLFGDYQRLHPKSSSFLTCGKPKVQGSFRENNHDDNNLCQALIIHEEQNHVTEINGKGGGDGEVVVGSFLNHGGIRNGNNSEEKVKVNEEQSVPVVSALDRAEACVKLEKKLKEIVMEDAETFVDIEEFLYHYSRLRSPLFVNMVDRVFAEFFC
ncbi:uncharacterized protein LOC131074808 [Cryptomeria japonica]|uniref:uncharacterized protein LOC131074808 n=1 Tax=Cryptomeria japonica TaxID=3369 RepID=UPI0027DA59AE|nr:uncharacterized protein LOC131074808 [Cryptomeria japonica]XP_057867475.2 uncharacterized protein LOC131074808 [Cryptomeria japonica]XP_057867476.2 uncharacterized protein LOC131074808 [Cryptomeria japonica]XP_057867477.2 uncharacterized protein LOC131074808 [Cryptomeria japonica]